MIYSLDEKRAMAVRLLRQGGVAAERVTETNVDLVIIAATGMVRPRPRGRVAVVDPSGQIHPFTRYTAAFDYAIQLACEQLAQADTE